MAPPARVARIRVRLGARERVRLALLGAIRFVPVRWRVRWASSAWCPTPALRLLGSACWPNDAEVLAAAWLNPRLPDGDVAASLAWVVEEDRSWARAGVRSRGVVAEACFVMVAKSRGFSPGFRDWAWQAVMARGQVSHRLRIRLGAEPAPAPRMLLEVWRRDVALRQGERTRHIGEGTYRAVAVLVGLPGCPEAVLEWAATHPNEFVRALVLGSPGAPEEFRVLAALAPMDRA